MPKEATQFKKGQSGNPGGRPKGVATRARELVDNDPERLLSVLLGIAEDEKARDSDRAMAAQAYMDRAWGKAPSYAPVEEGDPLGLDNTDREVKRLQDELAARRKTKVAGAKTSGTVDRGSENGAASTTG